MRLKFGNKSLEYTQAEYPKTKVLLINDEGAMYPVYFDKEAIDKSDAELFESALEKIYQDNFPNRAEDEKFNEIDKRLASLSPCKIECRMMSTRYSDWKVRSA